MARRRPRRRRRHNHPPPPSYPSPPTPPPTPTPISPAMEGFEVTRVVVAAFAAVVLLFGAAAAIKLRAARLCCGKGKEGSLRQLSEQGRALDESELRPLA
mmetsp:Transcript_2545/g.8990  ORF Transcript_2545/g.8990 Transcript_2545/m.8990 type:complete len:100 (-) Transcript_2545:2763-3062(-)